MLNYLHTLFKKSDFVISSNFSMPWLPSGIGKNSNLMKLKSKIPDRLYLGVSKLSEKKVILNSVNFLDKNNNEIEELKFSEVTNEYLEIEKVILDFLNNNNLDYGLEINVYSEIPRGHGLGFAGVCSALIATSLFLVSGKIKNDDLKSDLIDNYLFNDIYELSYKLEKIFKYNNTNGENSFMSFVKNKNPILFYRNDEKYSFFDLFDGEDFELPFDYHIIFSGNKTNTKRIESYLKRDESKLDKLGDFLDKNILSKLNLGKSSLDLFTENGKNYDYFSKSFSLLNIKHIKIFDDLFNDGFQENNIEKFISSINDHSNIISMIDGKTDFEKDFIFEFNKLSGFKESLGIMPIYSGKMGGGFLLVTKSGNSIKTLSNTMKKLKSYYKDSFIEYCGQNKSLNNGINLDYYLDYDIVPKEFKNNFILETKGKEIVVSDIKEVLEMNFDLVIDSIKNKIYIGGKKLTSKDIHSQVTAVNILISLFNNDGKGLSNNSLDSSTYSNSKSEMGGKIVYPLRRLFLDILNKEIDFEISGTSGTFELNLDFKNINIGILRQF